MSNTPHKLPEEFPELAEKMHDLLANDAHFVKMQADYDTANDAVHLAETDVKPTSDDHMADLRKARMLIKDQVYAYLTAK
jgi:uncharacterized protein YdcH (DUF465 family)